MSTDPDRIEALLNGIYYSTAVFFTSFSVSHWLFAMQYWSLSLRLTQLVRNKDVSSVTVPTVIVGALGLIFNLASGWFVIKAFKYPGNQFWATSTKIMNVMPSVISLLFLIDSLRRLRNLAKGVMHFETW